MNNVVLIGRLTRDPEVRYTPESKMAIARFSLAIDRPLAKGKEKQTDFPSVVVFGKQAENCEKYISKGRMVAVQGRIQTGSYKNKDGATVYTTEVVANNVEYLGKGSKDEANISGAGEGPNDGIPEGFQALDDEDIPF